MPTATVTVKWIPEVEKRIGRMVDDAIREATARYFDTLFATDIDPPAVNTPNPKEYAGEADAIEELAPLWGHRCGNETWYSGEFTVMRGVRPNVKYAVYDKPYESRLADRIKEIEMKKKRRVTIDPHTTTIGELMHLADCVLPQEILCPITRNGTAGELLEAVEKWLNDPQKPESKQEPTERTPTHFASIAPRYPGEQTPQDIAARKQREDAGIREFWANRENKKDDARTFAILSKNPQAVYLIDFVRYSNAGVRMSAAPKENIYGPNWHAYKSVVSQHPRNTQRTGAELLALLFPEPIMGHKENPSAWVAVEDGMPEIGEIVLVKVRGPKSLDGQSALGVFNGEKTYSRRSWDVRYFHSELIGDVSLVTHWRRIE